MRHSMELFLADILVSKPFLPVRIAYESILFKALIDQYSTCLALTGVLGISMKKSHTNFFNKDFNEDLFGNGNITKIRISRLATHRKRLNPTFLGPKGFRRGNGVAFENKVIYAN